MTPPTSHDLAFLDLGDLHEGRLALVHVGAAHLDVPVEILEELVDLARRPRRAPHLERRVLPDDPARDEQVAEVDGVVGMMVRDEDARPVVGTHAGLDELHAHARARIDEEALVPEAKERGGTPPRGIGRRRARAEEDGAHGRGAVEAGPPR